MSHRIFISTAFAFALAVPAQALDSDMSCTPREVRQRERTTVQQLSVMFPTEPVIVESSTGVTAYGSSMEVLVARIGPDGKPVLACTDSMEAAKRFLEAPAERVRATAQEK
jgi:hypothetical protein